MKCDTCVYFDGSCCGCGAADVWPDDLNECLYFEEVCYEV